MSEVGNISKFYKSFSGTDTLAFILMPGCTPVVIGSLTTISYSMFRNKKPVINIGRTNINGVTRGSRIYAGTMIFTLINQHWLKELQDQIDYIKDFEDLKVDELPLFDIMIVSANEYGNAVSMYIFGIDFTDEAQTISVEDLFTENTFSFVARDISTFKQISIKKNNNHGKSNPANLLNEFSQKLYVLKSSPISFDELGRLEQEVTQSKLIDMQRPQLYSLPRNLYLCSSKLIIGNDVAMIQTLLQRVFQDIAIEINGIFDEKMDKIVRKYQSIANLDINGIVDDKVYNSLLNSTSITELGIRLGIIVNKNGSFGYRLASINSDVQYSLLYKDQVEISDLIIDDIDGYAQKWYKTNRGYIIAEDVYSAFDEHNVIEFPTIKYGDNSVYVTLIQNALVKIFPDFNFTNGIMDENTVNKIKELQTNNGLYPDGMVNNETWLLLQSLAGNIKEIANDNFTFNFNLPPDTYHIANKDLVAKINLYKAEVSCDIKTTVKVSVIIYYPNGNTITKSKDITIQELTQIKLNDFVSAFVYNPKQGSSPSKVEWIIYPYNKQCYKWIINYDE